jgi:hypothetical protein
MNLSQTDKDEIRHALNGDTEGLLHAFNWHETPQGNDFWEAQYEAGQLSPEGRAALEAMLND